MLSHLLHALKTNRTLTILFLYYNNIGPAGAESLATALKTNTTRKLLIFGYGDDISESVNKKIYYELGKRIPF